MRISIKSPSENSPLVPIFIYILSWVITNILVFLGFGMNLSGLLSIVGPSLLNSAILFCFGLFNLIILVAYLLNKKFTDFFISLVMLVVLSFVTAFFDRMLEPYKMNRMMSNLSKISEVASRSRSFGNQTPVHVCENKENDDGTYNCKVCFCPFSLNLEEIDGIPYCMNQNNNQSQVLKFKAPCSDNRVVDRNDLKISKSSNFDLFGSDATKTFALYEYRNNKVETCNEYRVWENWDISIIKEACDQLTHANCLVQELQTCSTVGATAICQKKDSNTSQAFKKVDYSNSHSSYGFEQDECVDHNNFHK